jgi:hypothetical protein
MPRRIFWHVWEICFFTGTKVCADATAGPSVVFWLILKIEKAQVAAAGEFQQQARWLAIRADSIYLVAALTRN